MSPLRRIAPLLAPVVAVAGLAVTGCSIGDDGPRTTQSRDVAAFTRLDNRSSVDVELHAGEPQRVRVRAGEEVIGDVRTVVRDGTLHVSFDHRGFGGGDVVVEASVPRLDAIDVSGSGDLDVDGVRAGALDVRSEGSADITIDGTARRLGLVLDGSGDADLRDLRAGDARVSVSGSGDADVGSADRLDVRVDGSGDVSYRGDPELTEDVDGSGDLRRAG